MATIQATIFINKDMQLNLFYKKQKIFFECNAKIAKKMTKIRKLVKAFNPLKREISRNCRALRN